MLGIFSAEKLKYALRVPLNGVSGSKKPFKGTLRAQMSEGGECITLFSFTKIFDLGKFQEAFSI